MAVEYGTEHRFRKVDAIEADGASVGQVKLFEPRFDETFLTAFLFYKMCPISPKNTVRGNLKIIPTRMQRETSPPHF